MVGFLASEMAAMSSFEIPFNRPSTVGKEFEYIAHAIRRGQLSGDGHYTHKCNARIEELFSSI